MPIDYVKPNYNQLLPNIITGLEGGVSGRAASSLRQPIRNLETTIQILGEKDEIIDTITGKVIRGTISYDGTSLIRRTGSLTMVVDPAYMPSPDSVLWFNKKFRVYQGVVDLSQYPHEAINFLLGTFWLDEHTLDYNTEERTITLQLSDKMTRWDGVGLETKLKIAEKEQIPAVTAIKTLVESWGETDFGYIEEPVDGQLVPYDYEKQPGTAVMDIIEDLRDMYKTYICGYDVLGRFEIRRVDFQRESDLPEPKWEFDATRNDRADLTLSFSETYNLKDLKNRIMVVGSTDVKTGFTPMGTVQLTDIKSPYSIEAIGTHTKVISNPDLTNDMQCVQAAAWELYKSSTLQETVSISVAPVYFLQPNDIITITNPVTKKTFKYEIDKMSVDLAVDGSMEIDAHKIYFVQPSYGEWGTPTVNAVKKGISNLGWLSLGEERIRDAFGIMGNGKNTIFVQFDAEDKGGTQAWVQAYDTTYNQLMDVDLADLDELDFKSPSGARGGSKGDYLDRVLAHEMFHAVCNDYYGYFKQVNWPTWWKEGFAELVHGAKERYRSIISYESTAEKRNALIQRAANQMEGKWESASEDYVSAYLIACALYYLLGNKQNLQAAFQRLSDVSNGTSEILGAFLGMNDEEAAKQKVINEMKVMPIWQYLDNPADPDTGSIGGNHMLNLYGKALDAEDVFNNDAADRESLGFKIAYIE